MSMTGLEVFDDTVQKTNVWLKEIMDDMGPDRKRAYEILRAVLHTLRDRLTVDEAAHLSAQMPLLVRGIYFEGWHPAGKPEKLRSQEEFLERIGERLKFAPPIDPEGAARSVFRAIANHVDAGEVRQIRESLPQPIQALWP